MEEKKMTDIALYDGIAYIIFDNKCIEKIIDAEYDEPLTLEKVIEIAKIYGYEAGLILLICEYAFNGFVYKYGNYNNGKWYQVGTTCGYA
jgi:hypothetical protein